MFLFINSIILVIVKLLLDLKVFLEVTFPHCQIFKMRRLMEFSFSHISRYVMEIQIVGRLSTDDGVSFNLTLRYARG